MFNFVKRCPIQLKDVWFKRCVWFKRWGSGNDFAKQEVMWLRTQTARKFDPWKQYGVCWSCNLASRYIKVFYGIKNCDYESTATTKRHDYSVRFYWLLCYLASWTSYDVTGKLEDRSSLQSFQLFSGIKVLLNLRRSLLSLQYAE